MNVFIFDKDITPLGIIDAYMSLQWTRRYYKSGEFAFACPVTDDNIALLQKGNIIWPQGDKEAGVINYRNIKLDENGQEAITVQGRFLTAYLSQRIIWDSFYISDTAENIMQTLVNKNAINPTITGRAIPLLALDTLQGFTPVSTYTTPDSGRDNLADVLELLSTSAELGHRILFDPVNKSLKFEVYAGLDRTTSQSVNSPAIFSRAFENVLSQEYTDSSDNLKNVALINGVFTTSSAETAVSVTVGTATGLDRYEEYIDGGTQSETTKDADGNDITITQSDFETALENKGLSDLADHTEVKTFDSVIDVNSNLIYKTDFDLGDICPCLNKAWGVQVNARITEISEVYEETGVKITPTFGNNVPTLIDKIKQKMR